MSVSWSVEDLYLWDQAVYTERLIPEECLETIFIGYYGTASMDRADAGHSYGWFAGWIQDRPVIAHRGQMSGYTVPDLFFQRAVDDHCLAQLWS